MFLTKTSEHGYFAPISAIFLGFEALKIDFDRNYFYLLWSTTSIQLVFEMTLAKFGSKKFLVKKKCAGG